MSPTVPPISVITTSAGSVFAAAPDARLDLIGDVRHDLHGVAEEIAAALLVENRVVDLPVHVARARHLDADEALVVAEVEVGLGAVVGDEHLAVLKRTHRAGIDVQVRIELEALGRPGRALSSSRPSEATAMPLPRAETTPPVTKT